jgi:hypothetical protein
MGALRVRGWRGKLAMAGLPRHSNPSLSATSRKSRVFLFDLCLFTFVAICLYFNNAPAQIITAIALHTNILLIQLWRLKKAIFLFFGGMDELGLYEKPFKRLSSGICAIGFLKEKFYKQLKIKSKMSRLLCFDCV